MHDLLSANLGLSGLTGRGFGTCRAGLAQEAQPHPSLPPAQGLGGSEVTTRSFSLQTP